MESGGADAEAEGFRGGREGEEAVGGCDAAERVVLDEEVAVDVEMVGEFGKVGRGGNEQARFDHAADHRFEASGASGLEGVISGGDAAGLDEFDIDAMKALLAAPEVGGVMI